MTSIRAKIQAENDERVIAQLQEVDAKVQRTIVRKGTTAAGKVAFTKARSIARAEKQTGFTARSLKQATRSRKGVTTTRVGQVKQKRFKARKSTRVKGKNLSQIQRAGKPVPIHWLEGGTKAHTIKARPGKRLVFLGRGRRTKRNRNLIFARQVRNPGMKARHLLRRTARQSQRPAANAFNRVVRTLLRST